MPMEIELVTIHLITISITAIFILIADHNGLQYIRGEKQTLDLAQMKKLHYIVMFGLILKIITGGLMFKDQWGELMGESAFYIKMLMVAALVANSFVIGNLMHMATVKPFSTLSQSEKTKLLISGAVSGFCWLGAGIIGMFVL